MTRHFLSLLLFLVLFLPGCSTIDVHSDFDPEADFTSIHSFALKKVEVPGDALAANPLLYKRIAAAVASYLKERGYKQTNQGKADILVVLRGGVKEKMRVTDWGGSRPYPYGYRYGWDRPGRVDVHYYTEGTLVIDIIDRVRNEMIWQGLGTGILRKHTDEAKKQEAVQEYVRQILDQFPPGHTAKK
jgi:hypothetical protein